MENVLEGKKKKKKRKKKKGLGWGNPLYYGVSPSGESAGFSGDGGGIGENALKECIREIIASKNSIK